MARIGVIICHCGANIASAVDVAAVAAVATGLPGVVFAATHTYACSQPGQLMLKEAIAEHNLDRIVIGACSPRMHEATFRKLLGETKVNPFMLEIANLREQCAWVHTDRAKATAKAVSLVSMAVAKVARSQPLFGGSLPLNKRCLVIGGGIAGMQAALDIAECGYPVTIVEREPSLGGKMALLDKTFPTMDCSACICTPKMAEAGAHPRVTLRTMSEVTAVKGSIGNFEVTIKTRARYVDPALCIGCGLCEAACPTHTHSEFEQGLAQRKAIYKPFAQAVPFQPLIDAKACTRLSGGKCGLCAQVCPRGAVNFADTDTYTSETYGAIVLATGYQLIDWGACYPEYGGGAYPDMISGLQLERLLNASGPTGGQIRRPSDGQEPQTVVIVKCVGSRDSAKAKGYCSRACCMYAAKHARQVREKLPRAQCFVFYIDVRTPGKGYEEFYDRAREDGAIYIRGRVAKIYQEGSKLICLGEDSLIGRQVTVEADLVVLETAMEPAAGAAATALMLGISADKDGWLNEAHPKLRPVETQTGGVFVCGACQGPKDIADTVAQASAAAVKVCALFAHDQLQTSPLVCRVEQSTCNGCGLCASVCPYQAISLIEQPGSAPGQAARLIEQPDSAPPGQAKRLTAEVNAGLCQGCGACAAACRAGCIDLPGFTNQQILEEVDALCRL